MLIDLQDSDCMVRYSTPKLGVIQAVDEMITKLNAELSAIIWQLLRRSNGIILGSAFHVNFLMVNFFRFINYQKSENYLG